MVEEAIIIEDTNQIMTSNSEKRPFITSNNLELFDLEDIRRTHNIPVFHRNNTPVISQVEMVDVVRDIVTDTLKVEVSEPDLRLSHRVEGRIFEARYKKAAELLPHEKTIHYDRMAFMFNIPSIYETIDGKEMNLSFGGIKCYDRDNLSSRSMIQKFKFFIGFKVGVCTNLCIWSDGYAGEIKEKGIEGVENAILKVLGEYNIKNDIEKMKRLCQYSLTEQQFANFVGRSRIYQYLPSQMKREIPALEITDSQFNAICKGFMNDKHFGIQGNEISIWNAYNLITEAVKTSYIGDFLDRNVNAGILSNGLCEALDNSNSPYNWFLN